nr:hypothetical protein [Rhodococcus wratislaviensis]GLK34546.1 hypothetical protein GCM10017611_13940 [Rhodococcus wratislaviensis]
MTDPTPCSIDPESWDLDAGSYRAGLDAQAECLRCPRLAGCRREVAELTSAGTPPQSMIWAAVAYRHDGGAILTRRDLRAYYNRSEGQREANRGVAA